MVSSTFCSLYPILAPMHPLEKKVKQSIIRHGLIGREELVLVGVSAGPDSLALLHALHALAEPLGFSLLAVYVDHGLRPAETGAEWQLVMAAGERLDIPWRCGQVKTREYARRQGLSLEHAARDLRYAFFSEVAAATGARRIAVAHTADDQAEELLLRLLRGTARGGLSGMAPLARGRIIRPLLAVGKAEVLAYLEQRGISYAEDSSNRDLRFVRNRVRLELLPWLEERFNPNLRETLCRTALVLQEEEELLDSLTAGIYRQALAQPAPGVAAPLVDGAPAEVALALTVFNVQPRALQRRLLEKALLALALQPAGRQIEQLLRGAVKWGQGVVAHLAAGVVVSKDSRWLLFARGAPRPRRRRPQRR